MDTAERRHFHFSLSCIGEGNGNPLQCSCLENLRDGGAWWAAIDGVAQSRTRLKRLSRSSSRLLLMEHQLSQVFGVKPNLLFSQFSSVHHFLCWLHLGSFTCLPSERGSVGLGGSRWLHARVSEPLAGWLLRHFGSSLQHLSTCLR